MSATLKKGSSSDFEIKATNIGDKYNQGISAQGGKIVLPMALKAGRAAGKTYEDTLTLKFDAGTKQGGWNYTVTKEIPISVQVTKRTDRSVKESIDYKKETVTFTSAPGSESSGWTVNGLNGVTNVNANGTTTYKLTNALNGWNGDDNSAQVSVSKSADDTYEATNYQFSVRHRPARPAAGSAQTTGVYATPAKDGAKNGSIIANFNDGSTYEYIEVQTGSTFAPEPSAWHKLGDSGQQQDGLAAGKYWVRKSATDTVPASKYLEVTVGKQWTITFQHVDDAGNPISGESVKVNGSKPAKDTAVVDDGSFALAWNGEVSVDGYSLKEAKWRATNNGQNSTVGASHIVNVTQPVTVTYVWSRVNATVNFDYLGVPNGSGQSGAKFLSGTSTDTLPDWAKQRSVTMEGAVGDLPIPGAELKEGAGDVSSTVPFYRSGYKFVGWQVKANSSAGQTTKDVTADTVVNTIMGSGTSVTLVPKWQKAPDYTSAWNGPKGTASYGKTATTLTFDLTKGQDTGAQMTKVEVTNQQYEAATTAKSRKARSASRAVEKNWLTIAAISAPKAVANLQGTTASGLDAGTYTADVSVTYNGGAGTGLDMGENIKTAVIKATFTVEPDNWNLEFSTVNYQKETVTVTGDTGMTLDDFTVQGLPAGVGKTDVLSAASQANGNMTLTLTKALDSKNDGNDQVNDNAVNKWGDADKTAVVVLTRKADTNHKATSIRLNVTTRSTAPTFKVVDAYGKDQKGTVTVTPASGTDMAGRTWEHFHGTQHENLGWVALENGSNEFADKAGDFPVRLGVKNGATNLTMNDGSATVAGRFVGRQATATIEQYYKVTYKTAVESGSNSTMFRIGRVQDDKSVSTNADFDSIVNNEAKAPDNPNGTRTVWVKQGDKYTLPTFGSDKNNWETPGYDMVKLAVAGSDGASHELANVGGSKPGDSAGLDGDGLNDAYKVTQTGTTGTNAGITDTTVITATFRERTIDVTWKVGWDTNAKPPSKDITPPADPNKPTVPSSQRVKWSEQVRTNIINTWGDDDSFFTTYFPGQDKSKVLDPEDKQVGYPKDDPDGTKYTRNPWKLVGEGNKEQAFQVKEAVSDVWKYSPTVFGLTATRGSNGAVEGTPTRATSWRTANAIQFGAVYTYDTGRYLINFQVGDSYGEAKDTSSQAYKEQQLFENGNGTFYRASKILQGETFVNPPVSVKSDAASKKLTADPNKWILSGYYPIATKQGNGSAYDPSKANKSVKWDGSKTAQENLDAIFGADASSIKPYKNDELSGDNPTPDDASGSSSKIGWDKVQLHLAARMEDYNLKVKSSTLPLALSESELANAAYTKGRITLTPELYTAGGAMKLKSVRFENTTKASGTEDWMSVKSQWAGSTAIDSDNQSKTVTFSGASIKQGLEAGSYSGRIVFGYDYDSSTKGIGQTGVELSVPVSLTVNADDASVSKDGYLATMHNYAFKLADKASELKDTATIAKKVGLTVYRVDGQTGAQTVIYENGAKKDGVEETIDLADFTITKANSKAKAAPADSVDSTGLYDIQAHVTVTNSGKATLLEPKAMLVVSQTSQPGLYWDDDKSITLPEKDININSLSAYLVKVMNVHAFDQNNNWVPLDTVTITKKDSAVTFGAAGGKTVTLENAGPGQVKGADSDSPNAENNGVFNIELHVGPGGDSSTGGDLTANAHISLVKAAITETPSAPEPDAAKSTASSLTWKAVAGYPTSGASATARATASYAPQARYQIDGKGDYATTLTATGLEANTKHTIKARYTPVAENNSDEVYEAAGPESEASADAWTLPTAPQVTPEYDFGTGYGTEKMRWTTTVAQGDGTVKVVAEIGKAKARTAVKARKARAAESSKSEIAVNGREGQAVSFHAEGVESGLRSSDTSTVTVAERAAKPAGLKTVAPGTAGGEGKVTGFDAQYVDTQNVSDGQAKSMYEVSTDGKSWKPIDLSQEGDQWVYPAVTGTYRFRVAHNAKSGSDHNFAWRDAVSFESQSSDQISVGNAPGLTADKTFTIGLNELKEGWTQNGEFVKDQPDLIAFLVKRAHATKTNAADEYTIGVSLDEARAAEGTYPVRFYLATAGSNAPVATVDSTMIVTSDGGQGTQTEASIYASNFAVSKSEDLASLKDLAALNALIWKRSAAHGVMADGKTPLPAEFDDSKVGVAIQGVESPTDLESGKRYDVTLSVLGTQATVTVTMDVLDNGGSGSADGKYRVFSDDFTAGEDELVPDTAKWTMFSASVRQRANARAYEYVFDADGNPVTVKPVDVQSIDVDLEGVKNKKAGADDASVTFTYPMQGDQATTVSKVTVTGSGDGSQDGKYSIFAQHFTISREALQNMVGFDGSMVSSRTEQLYGWAHVFGMDNGTPLTSHGVTVTIDGVADIDDAGWWTSDRYDVTFTITGQPYSATVVMTVQDNGGTAPDGKGGRNVIMSDDFPMSVAERDNGFLSADGNYLKLQRRANVNAYHVDADGNRDKNYTAEQVVVGDLSELKQAEAGSIVDVSFSAPSDDAAHRATSTSVVTVYQDGTGPVEPTDPSEPGDESSLFANDVWASRDELQTANDEHRLQQFLFEAASVSATDKTGELVSAGDTGKYTVKVDDRDAALDLIEDGSQITYALTGNPGVKATVTAHISDHGGSTTDPDKDGYRYAIYSNDFEMSAVEADSLLAAKDNYAALRKRAGVRAFRINAEGVRTPIDDVLVDEASVGALLAAAKAGERTGMVTFFAPGEIGENGQRASVTSTATIHDGGTTDPETGARLYADDVYLSKDELAGKSVDDIRMLLVSRGRVTGRYKDGSQIPQDVIEAKIGAEMHDPSEANVLDGSKVTFFATDDGSASGKRLSATVTAHVSDHGGWVPVDPSDPGKGSYGMFSDDFRVETGERESLLAESDNYAKLQERARTRALFMDANGAVRDLGRGADAVEVGSLDALRAAHAGDRAEVAFSVVPGAGARAARAAVGAGRADAARSVSVATVYEGASSNGSGSGAGDNAGSGAGSGAAGGVTSPTGAAVAGAGVLVAVLAGLGLVLAAVGRRRGRRR